MTLIILLRFNKLDVDIFGFNNVLKLYPSSSIEELGDFYADQIRGVSPFRADLRSVAAKLTRKTKAWPCGTLSMRTAR